MEEREAWYWLLNVPNIQIGHINKLISRYQNPLNIIGARDISSILSDEQTAVFEECSRRVDDYRRDFEKLSDRNIRMILRGDKDYPEKLEGIPDEPYGFFVRGSLPDPTKKSVSIVGARRATHHGRWMATSLARDLAKLDVQIISGMAEGIDGYSHTGAIEGGGKTFAVLGSGIDVCFPASHISLYKDISENGGIISEYGPGAPGLSFHFPQRNRIISALADILVVVEAREKSGSLITVTCALSQGRDVMVVPGRPDDPYSEGCNRLLKEGAGCCTCAQDVIDQFDIEYSKIPRWPFSNNIPSSSRTRKVASESFPIPQGSSKTGRSAPSTNGETKSKAKKDAGISDGSYESVLASRIEKATDLNELEKLVLKNINYEPRHIDEIARLSSVPSSEVLGVLVALQIKGYVSSVTSGCYQAV